MVNTLYERKQSETVLEHTIIYTWVNPNWDTSNTTIKVVEVVKLLHDEEELVGSTPT